jgi:hypothetical protein
MNSNTRIITVPVSGSIGGRERVERIEGQRFHSKEAIREKFDVEVGIFTMSEFMDACNNTDDETPSDLRIDLDNLWVGYVDLLE